MFSLLLRKLVKEDADDIFDNWASDVEVTKYLTWNPHQSKEDTKAILDIWLKEYEDPHAFRFGIVLKESKELIGTIDVVGYEEEAPEIGYCLSRKHWNKGYMSEALQSFIAYLFSIGFNRIVIEADIRNIASNRVIEKTGFKFTHQEAKERCSAFKPEPIVVNWYELRK